MKIGQLIMLTTAMLLITGELYGQRSRSYSRQDRSIGRTYGQAQGTRVQYSAPKEQEPLTEAQKVQIDNCRKAVLQDDPNLLRIAMGKDFDINIKYTDGETLLKYAVKERKIKCIHYLLSLKPDVNGTDIMGLTPLFYCSRDKDADIAAILIDAGARTSIQDKTSRWTVFHKAAAENSGLDTLTVLMREKSGLNLHDRQGRTPLHLAVTRSPRVELQVVEFLLANGAKVNALDGKGRTALDLTRQKDIVDCLIRYHGRYNKNKKYNRPKYKRKR